MSKWTKKELLSRPIEHVDITRFDARPVIDASQSPLGVASHGIGSVLLPFTSGSHWYVVESSVRSPYGPVPSLLPWP